MTLAVALDGKEVPRSGVAGFDYRSTTNSLVFLHVPYKKGSEVMISYKWWRGGPYYLAPF